MTVSVGRRAAQSVPARWEDPTIPAHRLAPRLTPAVLLLGLVMLTTSVAYAQGRSDGETPAAEDICTLWGFTGAINGLCNAYCESMDCDDAEPLASEQACTRVLGKIETALGETPFPTCEDADDDGVPDGLDNCPDDPNADQADEYPSTPEGDACERFGCLCAAHWENETGAWDIRTLGDLACAGRSRPDFVSAAFPVFPPGGGSRPLMALLYQLSAGAFLPGTGSCFDAVAYDRGGISERITIEGAILPGDLTACRTYLSKLGCDFGGHGLTNADCFDFDTCASEATSTWATMCCNLAEANPDMPFTPTDYQNMPDDCKPLVDPICR